MHVYNLRNFDNLWWDENELYLYNLREYKQLKPTNDGRYKIVDINGNGASLSINKLKAGKFNE